MSRTQKHIGLLIFQLLFLSGVVNAQFYETIRSGRPGQSIGAATVGKSIFQLQSGMDQFGADNNDYNLKTRGYLANTGLR